MKKKLPCSYRETLARLLALEHFRNPIGTQETQAGTTVYTDHLPAVNETSPSKKGQLSTWRTHETADLNSAVQTLHRSGITMGVSDGLSRIKRTGEYEPMNMVLLPLVMDELLQRLPSCIKSAQCLRVSAERDTAAAARMVQRWREPANPISVLRPEANGNYDFLIAATYSDKVSHRAAGLLRPQKPFAFLVPKTLLRGIERTTDGKYDEDAKEMFRGTTRIVMAACGHTWLINHPEIKVPESFVLYINDDSDNHFDVRLMTGDNEWPHLVAALHKAGNLMKGGAMRKPDSKIDCLINTRSGLSTKTQTGKRKAGPSPPSTTQKSRTSKPNTIRADLPHPKGHVPTTSPERPWAVSRGSHDEPTAYQAPYPHRKEPTMFNNTTQPRPFSGWVGQQPRPGPKGKLYPVDPRKGSPPRDYYHSKLMTINW
jgi:hypothetical protein